MGAPSKRARVIRKADEFDPKQIALEVKPPKQGPATLEWTLADIMAARDEQMRGRFLRAARLKESMRTDDAIFVAKTNRLAPQRSIEVKMEPGKGARAVSIANEADALFGANGVGLSSETIADIHSDLVDHNIAFAQITTTLREDGSRLDSVVKAWPIEFVRWDPYDQTFKTRVDGGIEEPITHGDGRWVIFAKNEIEPFKGGCLLPAALLWARHAFGLRDWAKSSVAHGNAKVLGEMPEGVPLQKADNTPSDEAAAYLALVQSLAGDGIGGVQPAGAKTQYLVNTSSAWQVFTELVAHAEKSAARIYLGTDGTLGTQGGAPGVDITALFGVAATLVEGDLECLEKGFKTGVIEPWCALNFGDSSLAPTRKYQLPDQDSQSEANEYAERSKAFYADLKGCVDAQIPLTQEHVNALAARYNVIAPTLPARPAPVAAPVPGETPPLRAVG